MTLTTAINSVFSLSVAGYFNGEKFAKSEFSSYVAGMFRNADRLAVSGTLFLEIALPDGRWLMTINKVPGGYDYYIPDNREQEVRLYNLLLNH